MTKSNRTISVDSFVSGIRRGLRLMIPNERRKVAPLVVTSLFNGLLQTVMLVSIIPVVHVMLDPSATISGRFLSWLQTFFTTSNRQTFFFQLSGCLVGLVIFKGMFSWLQLGWMSRFSSSCETRMSSFLLKRILLAPYIWLVRQNSEYLRQRIFSFVFNWSRGFIRIFMKLVNDFILAVFIIAALIWMSPISGLLVAVFGTLLALIIFSMVRPWLVHIAETKRQAILRLSSISSAAVVGVKEVKMAGTENCFVSLFYGAIRTYAGSDARGQQMTQLPRIILEMVVYGALIGSSVVILLSGSGNPENTELFLLYGLAAIRLFPVFSTMVSGLTSLAGSLPIIIDLENLILSTETTETSSQVEASETLWHEYRLDNVSFQYHRDDPPTLRNVSLSIMPGRSYGVVGLSGAGKSTLIDLIAGLLEPTRGNVLIDGRLLDADHRMGWRRRFGYVAQRPFLFDASLQENITLESVVSSDSERLQRAIVLARLENVVSRLSGGLDGRIGEQGTFLSGGEQQRVAIARALYRGADLLVLDEATSSLDPIVEKEIAESLTTLQGQLTTIIVSHRIGLVRDCDEIWVLGDGGLTARGTHDELNNSSPLYYQMVTLEKSARLGDFEEDLEDPLISPVEYPKPRRPSFEL